MDNQYLYQQFDAAKAGGFANFDKTLPVHMTQNLADNIKLRPYQVEALNRYMYYLDDYTNKPANNQRLLFNMATGSGKTVIMAATILDLYRRGYTKFVFFVNRTTIVQKTIENFANPASSKYLFANNLSIDGLTPEIKVVDSLSDDDQTNIQIMFTTIQGLHTDLFTPRENRLSLEDIKDQKIVLLSDEAHHIQSKTLSKDEQEDNNTWEETIEKIFVNNPQNKLLEFTATVGEDSKVHAKYQNSWLYKYDLKQFRNDRYSKEIKLYAVSDDVWERMLHAALISQYRLYVAEEYGMALKPVILFKSKRIADSEENEAMFLERIQKLTEKQINTIFTHDTEEKVFEKLKNLIKKRGMNIADFIEDIQRSFAENRIRNVNSTKDAETLQLDINHLEDADNEIRVIFAVDKLNEGWDVLNLFDIVRLYETRDGRYNAGGEYIAGKTTISEAQLIGRGARYWPFAFEDSEKNKRRFDKQLDHDLRMLEELYYHSKRDTDYLIEIRQALVEQGMMDATEAKKVDLKFKDTFKQTKLYTSGNVYVNSLQENTRKDKKSATNYLQAMPQVKVKLSSGSASVSTVFGDDKTTSVVRENLQSKLIKFGDILPHIQAKAISRQFKFYNFSNLKKLLPELNTIQTFTDQIADVSIALEGSAEDIFELSLTQQLYVAEQTLLNIQQHITQTDEPMVGSKTFKPKSLRQVFREKPILVRNEAHAGVAMSKEEDTLYLDLATREWYAYTDDFGNSYEKRLVKMIDSLVDELSTKWDELYLIRNAEDLKLYDFSSERAFMPDYLLFLASKDGDNEKTYYVFIEPKGENIEAGDMWKQDFLRELVGTALAVDELGVEDKSIRIVGLDFYQPRNENTVIQQIQTI